MSCLWRPGGSHCRVRAERGRDSRGMMSTGPSAPCPWQTSRAAPPLQQTKLFKSRVTPSLRQKKIIWKSCRATSDTKNDLKVVPHRLCNRQNYIKVVRSHICNQCCEFGSGAWPGSEMIQTFLQDPDHNNWLGSRSGSSRTQVKILWSKTWIFMLKKFNFVYK